MYRMYRTLAFTALALAVMTLGFGLVAYFYVRQFANDAALIDLIANSQRPNGMRNNAGKVVSAVDLSGHLQTRVYVVLGVGLTLLLSGGALLLQSGHIQREQNVGDGAAGREISNSVQ